MSRSTSPVPSKTGNFSLLDFSGAIEQALAGKYVTKKEWDDESFYIFFGGMNNEMLMIHSPEGDSELRLRSADCKGTDWYVLKSKEDEPA